MKYDEELEFALAGRERIRQIRDNGRNLLNLLQYERDFKHGSWFPETAAQARQARPLPKDKRLER